MKKPKKSYIGNMRVFRVVGVIATLGFATLSSAIILPVYHDNDQAEATTGTAISSTLTFTSTRSVASVNLTVGSVNGTFATSGVDETAAFSISTDNYTGYTLLLTASSDTTTLSDGTNTFASISSVTSASDFADTGATGRALNNKWGYIPSYYNSEANTTNYYSAPTSANAATIMITDGANGSSSHSALEDEYTIGLGLRADYTNPSGTYTNATFLLQYTANPVAYVITYDGNGGNNTITNMPTPNPQYDDNNTATGVALSDSIPTSSNEAFSFAGWCTVQPASANSSACVSSTDETGTIFQAGDTYGIDLTSDNTITLYALWSTPRCNADATTIATNTPATDAVCMQDMNDDVIASMTEETQYQLYDNRDWKTYFLAKMKDGKVWMTQNLDLDLETEPTNVVALTSENTNLTTAFAEDGITYLPGYTKDSDNVITWTPSTATVNTTGTGTWSTTTTAGATNANALPQSFDYGEYYYYTTITGANQAYNTKAACETAHNDGTCTHYHTGNYYSWTAAVAMNNANSTSYGGVDNRYYNTAFFTAQNSICPKGWRLPQGQTSTTATDVGYYGDINYLWLTQGIMTNYVANGFRGTYVANGYINISNSPLYMARTGQKTNANNPGSMGYGYYWTSTVYNQNYSYVSYFQSGNPYPIYANYQVYRYYGLPVRCVAMPTTNTGSTTITFNKNDNDATGEMSNQTINANTLSNLTSNGYSKSGYGFGGWCSEEVAAGAACSSATYANAGVYYAAAGQAQYSKTLYAMWSRDVTIVFDKNADNAIGTMVNQDIPGGSWATLTANAYYRPGYRFNGWSTNPNGTGTSYNDKGSYTVSPTNTEAAITLYAKWTAAYTFVYNGNGADGGTTMSIYTILANNGSGDLYASNYAREGYGFLGWSTTQIDPDSATYTTELASAKIYGPNEYITANQTNLGVSSPAEVVLYAVWMKKNTSSNATLNTALASSPKTMQTFTTSDCSAMTQATFDSTSSTITRGDIIALEDTRDHQVYAVARSVDGNCWMMENLRLANYYLDSSDNYNPVASTINSSNTQFGSVANNVFAGLANPEWANFISSTTANSLYSTNGSNGTINITFPSSDPGNLSYRFPRYNQSNTNLKSNLYNDNATTVADMSMTTTANANVYSYGNYYTWAAAMANTTAYSSYSTSADSDAGSDAAGTSLCATNWELPYSGANNNAKNGSFYYLNNILGNNTSSVGSRRLRSFPINFLYSGYFLDSSAKSRGSVGLYWSRSASNSYNSYYLNFGSSTMNPSNGGLSNNGGFSVRCFVPGASS